MINGGDDAGSRLERSSYVNDVLDDASLRSALLPLSPTSLTSTVASAPH